ncbi:sensor histidine kinase [Pandoraea aquatica]|nr:ATP-binding protein [Pandoraea aquatica]
MSALAVGAVVTVTLGMWAYFFTMDALAFRRLSPAMQQELMVLRADPDRDPARLWELYRAVFDIDRLLPTLSSPDWLMLAILVVATIAPIVAIGLWVSRPLSRQFTLVAKAARAVSEGDFSSRVSLVSAAPGEVAGLADDFNDMTARLQQYERELRESSVMLSHELRTPLNAAMGRIQGMLDGVMPCDDAQLALVHRQLMQINRLVGDLHLISLARAGQLTLVRRDFSLRDLIAERLEWISPQLQRQAFEVTWNARDDVVVHGDRDRLGQVLSILIDNVMRYAAVGRVLEIDVAVTVRYVTVTVGDRGPGVPSEHLTTMLTRFWRAEHSRSRHSGGSGLGLAIASAICRHHGGDLTCRNREGGGLSVEMTIPPAHSVA